MTELTAVPWETRRKSIKPPSKLSWEEQRQYFRDHAHEVWQAGKWTYYLVKDWQKDRSQRYARGFFLVDGFDSELGDVYWRDVTRYGSRVR